MKDQPQRDPVPAFAREVQALFAEALAAVSFPDLDAAVLNGDVAELCAAQCEVERIEAELQEARQRVLLKTDGLMQRAQRALAYARIYADSDDQLAGQVERVAQGQAPLVSAPKRKLKARKVSDDQELFQLGAEPLADALPM